MFACRISGLKTSTNPSPTSSTCVTKSTTARTTFSRADSWIPTMFSSASTITTTTPPTMSHGFSRSGPQKIDR